MFSDEMKDKITKAFLSMKDSPKWQRELERYSIEGFRPHSLDAYTEIESFTNGEQRTNISKKAVYY